MFIVVITNKSGKMGEEGGRAKADYRKVIS